jgi:hypothetical protein
MISHKETKLIFHEIVCIDSFKTFEIQRKIRSLLRLLLTSNVVPSTLILEELCLLGCYTVWLL